MVEYLIDINKTCYPREESEPMFLAAFLLTALMAIVIWRHNQETVEQFVPVRVDDDDTRYGPSRY